MAKAKSIYVHEMIQIAIRYDGVAFGRVRARKGAEWTRWTQVNTFIVASKRAIRIGMKTLFKASEKSEFIYERELFSSRGRIKVDLPDFE